MLPIAFAGVIAGDLALMPDSIGKAIAAKIPSPLELLARRSPGERGAGALTQTKNGRAERVAPSLTDAALLPTERVLSNVRTRPPEIPATDAPLFDDPVALGDVPITDTAIVPNAGGGLGIGPPSILPPPIGSVGGGGGGGVIPDDPGPIPSVPEPTTWLMMLAGFFGVGGALRRRPDVTRTARRS